MKYLISINTDGVVRANKYEDNDIPGLEQLQAYVGGNIEVVPSMFGDDVLILVNEEGKLDGLRYNEVASLALRSDLLDMLVGDAVLVKAVGDELCGFDEDEKNSIIDKILYLAED